MLDPIVVRETLKGVLLTFASRDCQLQYQAEQPSMRIPAELYCQWFDDVYHPDASSWKSLFSDAELRYFAAFTETLKRHADVIAEHSLSEVLETKEWREICQSAQDAVNTMGRTDHLRGPEKGDI